jgi:hypothetical protein
MLNIPMSRKSAEKGKKGQALKYQDKFSRVHDPTRLQSTGTRASAFPGSAERGAALLTICILPL